MNHNYYCLHTSVQWLLRPQFIYEEACNVCVCVCVCQWSGRLEFNFRSSHTKDTKNGTLEDDFICRNIHQQNISVFGLSSGQLELSNEAKTMRKF